MNILAELKRRFHVSLRRLVDDPTELLAMVRAAQDTRFGDYQANCAMPLANRLGKKPRDVAAEIIDGLEIADLCEPPEIAGPGFINLRLRDDWLLEQVHHAASDERVGVSPSSSTQTFVVDFSSPNVAKPMHVGHIRSTVIGDALCRTLRYLGHSVISDNHLGDWGTQFGMIIYGFKQLGDSKAYAERPVDELTRLYKLVRRLVDYHAGKERLPQLVLRVEQKTADLENEKSASKANRKAIRKHERQLADAQQAVDDCRAQIAAVESNPEMFDLARAHADVGRAVLAETAKLHAGDAENLRLWHQFLPHCLAELERLYDRLGIGFDHQYGESFYNAQLGSVVDDFLTRESARESDGAICVFLDGYEAPMLIRKQDGAFLYATTDLATIQYRMKTWQPNAILYVVDHRQGEHFAKLFATARLWGYEDVELAHVSFGTVLGDDGRPFKTRSGDTVGLEGLLDEAIERAYRVVCSNDDEKSGGGELSDEQRGHIAQTVGIAALKYADLSQNRTSDYVFSYDKMLALNGNTATYMQYSFARVQGIFLRGGIDVDALRASSTPILLTEPAERELGKRLLAFSEAIDDVLVEYRPNLLTNYLFDLTKTFFSFYENCPVLKAESDEVRDSRLRLCDLTARIIRQGLELLGIQVVDRM